MNVDFTLTQVVGTAVLALTLWTFATFLLARMKPRRAVLDPPVLGGGALLASVLTIVINAMI